MPSSPITIKLSSELAVKIAADTKLRKCIGALLVMKAIYPEGRFKKDRATLTTLQHALKFKSLKCLTDHRIRPLIEMQLMKLQDGCYYLCSWDELLQKFNLPKKRYHEFELTETQSIETVILQIFWRKEKERFELCQKINLKNNYPVQTALQSVCGSMRKDVAAYHQLQMFCHHKGQLYDEITEYVLLYDRTQDRKFTYKADTHISTQHLSTVLGYAGKSGFCYFKKKMQEQGLIQVVRREYEVTKGIRTNRIMRDTSIGKFYFDSTTRTQKLRMVDAVYFIAPGTAKQVSVPVQPQAKAA